MSSILIYHHLGLGDHFMCHGIVREYAKKYQGVGLICLPHNVPSVSFMYRDLKNLKIIAGNDNFAREYIMKNNSSESPEKYTEVKIIGFEFLDRESGISLEKQFYTIAGIDISKKWSSFHVERDLAHEQVVFDRYAPKTPYVFLHEDASRNFTINRHKIPAHMTIFTPDPNIIKNAFDYRMVIEKATEIHVFDSSFMFMIDCLDYINPNQKLYVHRYARENPHWKLPILKKDWHIYLLKNYTDGLVKYLRQELHEIKLLRRILHTKKN